jgi:hypothetical protein
MGFPGLLLPHADEWLTMTARPLGPMGAQAGRWRLRHADEWLTMPARLPPPRVPRADGCAGSRWRPKGAGVSTSGPQTPPISSSVALSLPEPRECWLPYIRQQKFLD